MKLRFCPSIILLYTVASVEQHLRPHASGCTPAILKNEGMPEDLEASARPWHWNNALRAPAKISAQISAAEAPV
jgi:hypothetical protein